MKFKLESLAEKKAAEAAAENARQFLKEREEKNQEKEEEEIEIVEYPKPSVESLYRAPQHVNNPAPQENQEPVNQDLNNQNQNNENQNIFSLRRKRACAEKT